MDYFDINVALVKRWLFCRQRVTWVTRTLTIYRSFS